MRRGPLPPVWPPRRAGDGTAAMSLRINCQPVESQHMIVRRERDRLTELRVSDDDTLNLGNEHVLGPRPLREERGTDRRGRAGRDVSGPRGCVHPSENGVVLRTGLSNRQRRARMPQRTRDHQGHAPARRSASGTVPLQSTGHVTTYAASGSTGHPARNVAFECFQMTRGESVKMSARER